jgi:hypothetical protein
MLNIACVCVGSRYSTEYVEILYSGIRRNLQAGYRGRFTVFTDNPAAFQSMAGVQTHEVASDLKGWWAKLYLFSAAAFPKGERVLYFDLDTIITGPIDDIADYRGPFAMLHDAFRIFGFQSAIMAWEAGTLTGIWERWNAEGRPMPEGGDQEIIERYMLTHPTHAPEWWQDRYPGRFKSYKIHCTDGVPKGCSVVYFHGHPRPHEAGGWVKDAWRVQDSAMVFASNVKDDQLKRNVVAALDRPRWIKMGDGTAQAAIIVGGGPSVEADLWRIRGYQLSGDIVYATNNTWQYLKEHGIRADAQVIHDAREDNLAFVSTAETLCYFASQCDPKVLDAAAERLICWHPHTETALEAIGDSDVGPVMVSGGSTIGLNALSLAYILGHRHFKLFGFDSCYQEGNHHAYAQALNDGELVIDVTVDGQQFHCAPWMIQQAEQFVPLVNQLAALGCTIQVYGTGLIPTLASHTEERVSAADLRAQSLLKWLDGYENPVGAEIGVFAGELSRRLLSRSDLTLYMVDSWGSDYNERYAQSGDFHAKLSKSRQDHFYGMTRHMVQFAGERAKIVRKDSVEAAKGIPDGSLDFAFIDAEHTYEACKADIEAWLPKVRKGGFISGHDYENPDYPAWGVKRAVTERFGEPELGLNFTWRVQV